MKCVYAAVVAGSLGAAMPVAQAAQESYVYTQRMERHVPTGRMKA
jgi:hypothetical protein